MKLQKRILASFMVAVMCFSLMGSPVFAQDTITDISDAAKTAILKDAESKQYFSNTFAATGKTMNLGEFHVPAQENGEYTIQTCLPKNYLSGNTEVPGYDGATLEDILNGFEVCAYAAVLDTDSRGVPLPDAEVQYYYVDVAVDEDSGTISGTIPVGETGSAVIILQQLQIAGAIEFSPVEDCKTVVENVDVSQTVDYQVDYSMSDNLAFWMKEMRGSITDSEKLHYTLTISLPAGMEVNTSDYTFDSKIFECTKIEKLSKGQWLCTFKLKLGEWDFQDGKSINDEELMARLKEQMKLTFSTTMPPELTAGGQTLVGSMLLHGWYDSEVAWQQYDFQCISTAAIVQTVSAVTITPADMTIYEGGDAGYEAVVGDGETTYKESNSLPHPLFKITAPSGTNIDATNLIFKTEDNSKQWRAVQAGATNYYHFEPVENTATPAVRVTYTDAAGNQVLSDEFDWKTATDVFETYTIALYPGENGNDFSNIKAYDSTEGQAEPRTQYPISVNTGTLTVRAVADTEPGDDPTIDVINESALQKVESGKAVAVEPEGGTTYTLNNIGVPLLEGNKPSLLFDSIIEDNADSTTRTDALTDRVDEKLGAVGSNITRHYEVKYLDLVDANDGNAWITSSAGMDIYWGYPEGTGIETAFHVLHFEDLHRDGTQSGFEISDIQNAQVTELTENEDKLQNTEYGIKFHVEPGNFSPYVLVWEKTSTSHNPGIIPTPDPDPTPTPEPEEPDQPELERDDHYAYIFGYEDNTIRPENDITRAEVATIFYRLLTDESREAYRTTDHDFTDVSADAWYAEPVATLAGAGLLAGYEDGSFRPDAPITRAEYAAIATRFDELAAAESNFTDISGHWAEDAINAAYGAGWVGGYEDGTFRPDQNISRAEAMALINRVLERAVDSEGMLDEMTHWADNDPEAWYYADIQEATHSHTYEREEGEQYETWTALVPHKVF